MELEETMLILEHLKFGGFMRESNKIEGDIDYNDSSLGCINPNDVEAVRYVLEHGINNVKDLLHVHKMLTEHLKVDWSGKLRTVQVYVRDYTPPKAKDVPELLKAYFKKLPKMSAWKAHNEFQKIHPFKDFNGRTGRLIWLQKAIDEGYNFGIPFLHKYYYQSLDNY